MLFSRVTPRGFIPTVSRLSVSLKRLVNALTYGKTVHQRELPKVRTTLFSR
ncbi:MAG: hypothetical protein H8F28_00575 [Fibrella sp.]|nr:hypothetical protein [Armatimonadota bacterium]